MASFAKRFNKGARFNFDSQGLGYRTLAELYSEDGPDVVHMLHAIYINTKGKFADNPVFGTDGALVNIPAHMTDVCREIITDEDAIDDINAGRVGFTVYQYESEKFNRVCYGVNFVDVEAK